MMSLKDKVALVTGAEEGATVFASDPAASLADEASVISGAERAIDGSGPVAAPTS